MNEEEKKIYLSLIDLFSDNTSFIGKWIAMDQDGRFFSFLRKPHIFNNKGKFEHDNIWSHGKLDENGYDINDFTDEFSSEFEIDFGNSIRNNYEKIIGKELDWKDSLISIN